MGVAEGNLNLNHKVRESFPSEAQIPKIEIKVPIREEAV